MMIQSVLFVVLVVGGTALLSWPLGSYMKWAMDPADPSAGIAGAKTRSMRILAGPAAALDQDWKRYMLAMLAFNVVMFVVTYSILALQHYLPLNPDGREALEGSLIFNTAASFTSNTNLQHYSGEVSLSYLSQLAGLMWLQFVSAATGIAALAALARGLAGRPLGNFFVDVQRASFLVLLPVALVFAILLVLGGVPMTFDGAAIATTLEGVQQTIARGPVAAFVTIKQLGTNGGGFFGPNSTHPLENPTFWTNIIEMVAIILVPMESLLAGRKRELGIAFDSGMGIGRDLTLTFGLDRPEARRAQAGGDARGGLLRPAPPARRQHHGEGDRPGPPLEAPHGERPIRLGDRAGRSGEDQPVLPVPGPAPDPAGPGHRRGDSRRKAAGRLADGRSVETHAARVGGTASCAGPLTPIAGHETAPVKFLLPGDHLSTSVIEEPSN